MHGVGAWFSDFCSHVPFLSRRSNCEEHSAVRRASRRIAQWSARGSSHYINDATEFSESISFGRTIHNEEVVFRESQLVPRFEDPSRHCNEALVDVVLRAVNLAKLVHDICHNVSVVFRTRIPLGIVIQPIKESPVQERLPNVGQERDAGYDSVFVHQVLAGDMSATIRSGE